MNQLRTKIAGGLLLLGTSFNLQAQEEVSKTKWSLEIDPVTFVFRGFSAHLRVQPKGSLHVLVGAGVYAMEMPDLLVGMNGKNKGLDWKVRLNQGYGVFGEYHLSEVNRKWFVGTQLGIQEYKIQKRDAPENEKFTNFLAMGYFGYTWKPFKNKLYIKPWAGIGYTSKMEGSNMLGTREYDISPVTMFATLHVGYTF